MNLYTIRDKVAEDCGPVFQAKNNGVAVRNFEQMFEKNAVSASDFVLLLLGTFDQDSGRITAYDDLEVVVDGTVIQERLWDEQDRSLRNGKKE